MLWGEEEKAKRVAVPVLELNVQRFSLLNSKRVQGAHCLLLAQRKALNCENGSKANVSSSLSLCTHTHTHIYKQAHIYTYAHTQNLRSPHLPTKISNTHVDTHTCTLGTHTYMHTAQHTLAHAYAHTSHMNTPQCISHTHTQTCMNTNKCTSCQCMCHTCICTSYRHTYTDSHTSNPHILI